jgi:hypothetical protein
MTTIASSPFTGTNNLIGQQISPTPSATTTGRQTQANTAGTAYGNYQFQPWQGVGTLNNGPATQQVIGANDNMQAQTYNFGGANQQYRKAQSDLGAWGDRGGQSLQGLQGLGDLRAQAQEKQLQGVQRLGDLRALASEKPMQGV